MMQVDYCRPFAGLLLAGWLGACTSHPSTPYTASAPPAPITELHRSYCLDASLAPAPGWLVSGYGSGATLRDALQQAYQDVAEKLSVRVDASTETRTQRDRAGNIESEIRNHIRTAASAELDAVERFCLDQSDPNGSTHVAVRVDLRAPAARIAHHLQQRWGSVSRNIEWQAPAAIHNSVFVTALKRELATLASHDAVQQVKLHLHQRHHRWQLDVDGEPLPLPVIGLEELVSWHELDRNDLRISLIEDSRQRRTTQLQEGDEFVLHLNRTGRGYLTLLNVYGDAQVDILRENIPVQSNARVPERGVFASALLQPGESARDIYIALVSPAPTSVSQLLSAQGRVLDLPGFISWLAEHRGSMDTLIVQVRPR
jgi:hypothetical protein